MTGQVQLSIIIVNYNVKYFLEQCLYSVRAAVEGLVTEIFVVDNHSADGSIEYLQPKFPEVIFIENKDNPGFSKANNQAILQSRGEYVLLLNPDTVIGEHILQHLYAFMSDHPEAGGVGVKMLDGHGRFLAESKRSYPSPWISFCKLFGLSKLFPRSKRFSAYSLLYLNENELHQVDVLSGAFMLLRREALDKVGLLDETFFMYGEDIDLSYRIVLGGYKNYYIPERILHYKGESTKRGDKKFLTAFYGAMLIFYKKYYPQSGKLMSGLIRMSIALRSAYSALFEKAKQKKAIAKHCRLLVVSLEEHFDEAKNVVHEKMPELLSVDLLNLNEPQDINTGYNEVKEYTDIAFYYPDISFYQMLAFMDNTKDKKITYHIYHNKSGRLISSGQ
ncbi:MAG: glycosyltransferase family 2 protein [Tannerella sp.]|jgi:GT2 family glycosyltransferase|nr:glycosyltransferase family 2 protein [Tannerella sp.]